jgi:hypothetical protein
MIQISTTLQTVLLKKPIEFCYLIKIKDFIAAGQDKLITDNPFNVTLSNGEIYVSDGTLLAVTPLSISTNVDREEFSFSIADNNFFQASLLETNIINKRIEARMAFYNEGVLLTNIFDTLLMYSGYGNNAQYIIKTEEQGEAYARISCTSPMSDLEHKKGIYLNKEFMRNQNPQDSSCDQVYAGSGSLQLKWGKR